MQTKRTMESGIPYIVLGTLYAYLLYLSWTPESLQLMFASEYFLPEVCPLFMDLPHINIHNSTPIDSRMHANSVSEWILFQKRYRDLIFLPFIPCISYWTCRCSGQMSVPSNLLPSSHLYTFPIRWFRCPIYLPGHITCASVQNLHPPSEGCHYECSLTQ